MTGETGGSTTSTPPSQARIALRSVARSIAASARSAGARLRAAGARIAAFARPVTGVISTVGWLVLAGAAVSLGLAGVLGWIEFAFLGATLLAALVVSIPFVFGRMSYRVGIELQPSRVVAGERAIGRLVGTAKSSSCSPPGGIAGMTNSASPSPTGSSRRDGTDAESAAFSTTSRPMARSPATTRLGCSSIPTR